MSKVAIEVLMDRHMALFAAGTVNIAHKADLQTAELPYAPKPGMPFYTARLSAYTSHPITLGINPVYQERGIYQINIQRPASEGSRIADLIARDLVVHFGRAYSMNPVPGAAAQAPVIIEYSSEQPSATRGLWITVPVLVTWFTGA